MEIIATNEKLDQVKGDILVLFFFQEEKPSGEVAELDKIISGSISQAIKLGDFKGNLFEVTPIYTHGKAEVTRVFLVGAGKKEDFDKYVARNIAGSAARRALKLGPRKVSVLLNDYINAEDVIEGFGLAAFDPGIHKSKKENPGQIEELVLIGSVDDKTVKKARSIVQASNWVRELTSQPSNIVTPAKMVDEARKLAKTFKFGIEVINETEAKKRGFGAFVGVAKGSAEPSYVVVLKYSANSKETLAVVGKGITFDSGGISLKPSDKMHEMKYDMAGAAAGFGFMKLVGELKPKLNVIMITPLTENLPGGRAQKPGDVMKSLSGKTIEVINTDAEGRLVLADGLTFAQSLGATKIVDLATLTGAVIVALGNEAAAILGNKKSFTDTVISASKSAGERLWELPLYPEHKELLKSDIADIANIPPSRGAGVIAGAVFLKEFIDDSIDWVHLDIAGTAWLDGEKPYMAKGASGFGLRTLVNLTEILERDTG